MTSASTISRGRTGCGGVENGSRTVGLVGLDDILEVCRARAARKSAASLLD